MTMNVIYAVPTSWFKGVSSWFQDVIGSDRMAMDTNIDAIRESNRQLQEEIAAETAAETSTQQISRPRRHEVAAVVDMRHFGSSAGDTFMLYPLRPGSGIGLPAMVNFGLQG